MFSSRNRNERNPCNVTGFSKTETGSLLHSLGFLLTDGVLPDEPDPFFVPFLVCFSEGLHETRNQMEIHMVFLFVSSTSVGRKIYDVRRRSSAPIQTNRVRGSHGMERSLRFEDGAYPEETRKETRTLVFFRIRLRRIASLSKRSSSFGRVAPRRHGWNPSWFPFQAILSVLRFERGSNFER